MFVNVSSPPPYSSALINPLPLHCTSPEPFLLNLSDRSEKCIDSAVFSRGWFGRLPEPRAFSLLNFFARRLHARHARPQFEAQPPLPPPLHLRLYGCVDWRDPQFDEGRYGCTANGRPVAQLRRDKIFEFIKFDFNGFNSSSIFQQLLNIVA